MPRLPHDRPDPSASLGEVTRRHALGSMLGAAVLAHPLGSRLLTMPPMLFELGGHTELQPLLAEVRRVAEAMAYLGEPFTEAERTSLDAAANMSDEARAVAEIQRILDPNCLLTVHINPESRVSVERGAAPPRLVEQGWRAYLVKVRNESGATGRLDVESPQARPVFRRGPRHDRLEQDARHVHRLGRYRGDPQPGDAAG